MPMIDAALTYVKNGYKILPCCWTDDTHLCKCGRNHQGRDIGKVPLTEHGFKDYTETLLGAKFYWTQYPKANIGIMPDGFFVLDVDADHGGLVSLDNILAITGLFKTRTIRSGGGGLHFYFKGVHQGVGALHHYPGIEIKGNRSSYVLAPPSLHKSGNLYAVENDIPISEPPRALLNLLKANHPPVPNFSTDPNERIPMSSRNVTLTRMAGTLRRVGFTAEEMAAILLKINKDRCDPPLPEYEVIRTAHSIGRKPPAPTPSNNFRGGASLEIRS